MHFDFLQINQLVKNSKILVSSQNFIYMRYFEENMLENESKCNNVTFNMCCYSISVIFQFLKVTDSL